MMNTSCKICNSNLEVEQRCRSCNEPTRMFCHSCGMTTQKMAHPACVIIGMHEIFQEIQISRN